MSPAIVDRRHPDILADWRFTGLAYCLPIAAMVVSGASEMGTAWRAGIWSAACAVMGIACLVNAIRCGRVHCYFTAPFFFVMALTILLFGAGWLPLGRNGWNVIGVALLAGSLILTYGPERVLGKYTRL